MPALARAAAGAGSWHTDCCSITAMKKILIVDDDPAVLESYRRLLRRLGHTILLSDDGDTLRRDPQTVREVDLLILDYRMPGLCGLDLLAILRRHCAEGCGPAVLLVSAFLSEELRKRATLLGVTEIIEKPVDPLRLIASVRAALGDPRLEPNRAAGSRS